MSGFIFLLLLAAASVVSAAPLADDALVEQMHISLTETYGTEMRAIWVVMTPIASAPTLRCYYGFSADSLDHSVPAQTHTYTDGGFSGTIYTAIMNNLDLDSTYFYKCGGAGATFSKVYRFRTAPPIQTTATINIIQWGDMGVTERFLPKGHDSYRTQLAVTDDSTSGKYHLILNVGDTSYADDYPTPNAHIIDKYFTQMQECLANTPMMLNPGNHEDQYHFAGYLNRTRMPSSGSGPLSRFYYSFNYGPMHVISYSTEHSIAEGSEQWSFIVADLAKVDRTQTPWLVAMTHHPMYCTNIRSEELRCQTQASKYRAALESKFRQYNLDLHLSGHNHDYERTWPTFNGTALQKDYNKPVAPIYVVSGAAGTIEGGEDRFIENVPNRAYHSLGLHTGYAHIGVNRTHLTWDYVDSDTLKVVDTFVITK